MASECDHPVGYIPDSDVKAKDWNEKLMAFVAKVDDFNVRGQRDQINHPGFTAEFKFCPDCGQRIDRAALGLLTYGGAFEQHLASKS